MLDSRTASIELIVRDVPALTALLVDDEIDRHREIGDPECCEAAFDAVSRDPSHYLASVRGESERRRRGDAAENPSRPGPWWRRADADPGAPHRTLGAAPAASVRLCSSGTHDYGRARGARLAQLATNTARTDARCFREHLGYVANRVGFKRPL